jgi:hypothetical protein
MRLAMLGSADVAFEISCTRDAGLRLISTYKIGFAGGLDLPGLDFADGFAWIGFADGANPIQQT